MGNYLKYVFITALTTGLFLSFHETLWTWALIPVSIVWVMIALGLAIERREQNR
jgi:hypothetical protein